MASQPTEDEHIPIFDLEEYYDGNSKSRVPSEVHYAASIFGFFIVKGPLVTPEIQSYLVSVLRDSWTCR